MRIVTYNVNGIAARLGNFLRWLGERAPDVVCLQELKIPQEKFPESAIREAGYGVIWHGQKSWNGVPFSPATPSPERSAARCPATRTMHTAATSRRRSRRLPSDACTCRTAIRRRVRNSTTSSNGSIASRARRRALLERERRSSWPATTTSSRPSATSISPNVGSMTRCSDRGARGVPTLAAQGWTDALRTLHPDETSIPSGISFATPTRAMRACASIICCSIARSSRDSRPRASSGTCAAGRSRATTRPCGST